MDKKVAILGPYGSDSHGAVTVFAGKKMVDPESEVVTCDTIEQLVLTVIQQRAESGIVPVDPQSIDVLARYASKDADSKHVGVRCTHACVVEENYHAWRPKSVPEKQLPLLVRGHERVINLCKGKLASFGYANARREYVPAGESVIDAAESILPPCCGLVIHPDIPGMGQIHGFDRVSEKIADNPTSTSYYRIVAGRHDGAIISTESSMALLCSQKNTTSGLLHRLVSCLGTLRIPITTIHQMPLLEEGKARFFIEIDISPRFPTLEQMLGSKTSPFEDTVVFGSFQVI